MCRLGLAGILSALAAPADPHLPALLGDHMVLQRDVPVNIWGSADPGERIEVRLGSHRPESTVATSSGAWKVELPPLSPGGPFTLTVTGKRAVVVRDVLVGEVWLLSGQSNMNYALRRAAGGEAATEAAHHYALRLFKVPLRSSLQPEEGIDSSWKICSPETAADFSAVGYFFGDELHRALGVPVGLIQSEWSGSAAEEWTPKDLLESKPELAALTRQNQDPNALPEFGVDLSDFSLLRAADGHDAVPVAGLDGGDCRRCGFNWTADARDLFTLVAPEKGEAGYAVRIQGLLGADNTPVFTYQYREDDLPVDLSMYSGIRFRFRGKGSIGFSSVQPTVADGSDYEAKPLSAKAGWQSATIPFASLKQPGWGKQMPFTAFSLSAFKISARREGFERPSAGLFNAMIVPLTKFAIRGAAWYQGESNTGRAWQYRTLLPAMIQGWRRAWGRGDFPFLIVQLPNYGAGSTEPAGSTWAELREAQLLTARTVPSAGLVVTIDVGESDNVHPAQKQPVGHRLALRALSSVYGQAVVSSGPTYESMQVAAGAARLRFGNVGAGLATRNGTPVRGFAVAGEDRRFVWADAEIEGNEIVVRSASVPQPVAVRYGWADNPDCNLINKEGLPASPFRTDNWPAMTEKQ